MKKIRPFIILTIMLITYTKNFAQKNFYKMDTMNQSNASLICNLTGKDFTERVEFLRATIFSRVNVINELPDGYEYVFEQPEEFALQIAEFIIYERQCCPFFHFSLNFEPDGGPVRLQVYGSKEIK